MNNEIRAIEPLLIPEKSLDYSAVQNFKPELRMVDPTILHIDSKYQRNLTRKSTRLIFKIIAEWSWNAFKPPIVTEYSDGRLFVLDGQHTCIAAATHPYIEQIPVFIVDKLELPESADAFIRHNKDRTAMSPIQIFKASVEAGDEDAISINMALNRAKVSLVASANLHSNLNECSCLGTLQQVYEKYGMLHLRKTLDICVAAELRPISAYYVLAVSELISSNSKIEYDHEGLALVIQNYPYPKLCSDIELKSRAENKHRKVVAEELIKKQYELRFLDG